MPDWKHFTFEREKFRHLILYFSKRGADEGLVIGSTKLNKLLFFTDFRAYAELGTPVTGARYQRLELGPAARAMLPVREEMVSELGEAHFEDRGADDKAAVLIADAEPDLSLFSPEELGIADAVFEELRHLNAKAASDYSHYRSAGWRVMENGDDIPYESAWVSTDPAPTEAIELGRQLAAQYQH
jgi:hypothetical protein